MTPALFAQSVLGALQLPLTDNNVAALVAFQAQEGGHEHNGATFNPLNTMQGMPGSRDANLSMHGIKAYSSWDEGIAATVKTFKNGLYGGILAALRRSAPPEETLAAIGASPWGWYDPKTGARLPFAAALAMVRSPERLTKYGNMAYRGASGILAASWFPGALGISTFAGALPLWSAALLVLSSAVIGSQLAGRKTFVGAAAGAGAGLVGWYFVSRSLEARA